MSLFSFKPLAIHDRIGSADLFKAVVITEAARSAPLTLTKRVQPPVKLAHAPVPASYAKISSVLAPIVIVSAFALIAAITISSSRPRDLP